MTTKDVTEVRSLRKISAEINATLELDELCDTLLRTMDELFGFDHSLILLLDDDGDFLEVVASHGYPDGPVSARVPVGTGPIGVAAKRRRMVRLGGLRQQRAYLSTIRRQMEASGRAHELSSTPPLPGLADVESQIGIPLMVKDALIGVFFVESDVKRTFSEQDETLIEIVANQAASAIQSARLLSELSEAHQRLGELNESLEQRVHQRTEELERSHRELKETQAQLLQTAKLAALGDLVAGVAHEINTPLGAIHSNADLARRASERISAALARDAIGTPDTKTLEHALVALDAATSTTLTASNRIAAIIGSLRSFARLDEAERKKADLHEGLESTLTLLQHKLQERIQIVRRYGELPQILCYPNRLNQVFMNLLTNAIHAIEGHGTITITTRVERERVFVELADTGSGIPAEHLDKIFDPGFTTKGSGVGTGLGLAISFRIIQEHEGTITVASELGNGTVFTVGLPIVR